MKVTNPIIFIVLILAFLTNSSCNKKDDGVSNVKGSDKTYPIYNQAYSENFDSDHIDQILNDAKNAYVLIDPFQNDVKYSVSKIKGNGNQVGAYISVGSGENWRDDFQDLKPFLVEKEWDQWEGEFYISTVTTGALDVMKARIDKIAGWGCDWVEFDNMDWVDEGERKKYGYVLTEKEVVNYFQTLCDYVHQKGMKCMAKNRTKDAFNFDGVTLESYEDEKDWWDAESLKDFISKGKVVVIIHYNEKKCDRVYKDYMDKYGDDISYLCESRKAEKYVHYNQ